MMTKWFFKLTGGRPMLFNSHAFTDTVSGMEVFRFTDRLGRKWLANSAWGWFRVQI